MNLIEIVLSRKLKIYLCMSKATHVYALYKLASCRSAFKKLCGHDSAFRLSKSSVIIPSSKSELHHSIYFPASISFFCCQHRRNAHYDICIRDSSCSVARLYCSNRKEFYPESLTSGSSDHNIFAVRYQLSKLYIMRLCMP